MKEKRELTEKQKKRIAAASLILFAVLTVLICWFVGRPMLRFMSEPEHFRLWVDQHGLWGRAAYVGMMLLQVFVAVIPGEPLEIGGGYTFGAVEGTLLCMLGASLGSFLVFAFVRRFGMRAVEIFFPKEKIQSLRFLQSSRKRDVLFFFIFMIPGTPKDLLCYFAGLTDMKLTTWFLICTVGRIPSIVTSTVGGDALGGKNYWFAIIVFAVTVAVSVTGLLIYQIICKRQEKHGNHSNTETD
ncbi:MAG: TVP38/TMEM64 family protein [Clostridiales bacterium]|nr:TVP38/TMEM64 family protein [Clostridiales bacterium]